MFGPETGVLVGALNSYYVTNGATDIASLTPSPSGFLSNGDIIWNGKPTVGQPAFWTVLTGGSTPAFQAGPTLGNGTTTTVSLTAAQIDSMYTTPISLIAAPGAGNAIWVSRVVFEMTTTSTAFTGGGAVSFPYHGTSTNSASSTIPASVVTSATPGTTYTVLGESVTANGTTVLANTGVDITNASAVFATGTGSAKIIITYSVIAL